MIINTLLIFAAIAVSVVILVARDWRWEVFGLALLYLIGFALIIQIWPFTLATVKLVAGLMSVALLSTVKINLVEDNISDESVSYRIFIFLLACLSWVIISATIGKLNSWLPIAYTNLYIGLVIIMAGLIKFSLGREVFDITIGLLAFLAGFDIVYSSLEGSALVTGIYSLIVLLICILSSYLEGGFSGGIER